MNLLNLLNLLNFLNLFSLLGIFGLGSSLSSQHSLLLCLALASALFGSGLYFGQRMKALFVYNSVNYVNFLSI